MLDQASFTGFDPDEFLGEFYGIIKVPKLIHQAVLMRFFACENAAIGVILPFLDKSPRIFFCTVSFLSTAFFHHFNKGIVGVVYEPLHDFLLLRGRCLRRIQAGEHVLVGAALEGDRFDADFIQ